MRKIVVNTDQGGGKFELSQAARDWCKQADEAFPDNDAAIPRDDPTLVRCIAALGNTANGPGAKLAIVEIPAGIAWSVSADPGTGYEWVTEEPREWRVL
jgi:hypothetical protein